MGSLAAVLDEPRLDHPVQHAVEVARRQPNPAGLGLGNPLHDLIAVVLTLGQREQNAEVERPHRQQLAGLRLSVHGDTPYVIHNIMDTIVWSGGPQRSLPRPCSREADPDRLAHAA